MDVSSRQDVFWSGKDGLRLHARRHLPDRVTPTGTVVCIPGLTRNAADFEAIAGDMAAAGWQVLAVDLRGRAGSGRAVTARTS